MPSKSEHMLLTKLEDPKLLKFTLVKMPSKCLISQELLLNPLHTVKTKPVSPSPGLDSISTIPLMYSVVLIAKFLLRLLTMDTQTIHYLNPEESISQLEPEDTLATSKHAMIVDAVTILKLKSSLSPMFLLNHKLLSTHLLLVVSESIGNSDLMEALLLIEFLLKSPKETGTGPNGLVHAETLVLTLAKSTWKTWDCTPTGVFNKEIESKLELKPEMKTDGQQTLPITLVLYVCLLLPIQWALHLQALTHLSLLSSLRMLMEI